MKFSREDVISELDTQIRWIEEIDGHKFPGWCGATMAMRYAMMLLKDDDNDIHHMSQIIDEYEKGKKNEAVKPDILDFSKYTNGRKQRRKAWCGACGLRIRIGSNKQDRSNFCERCGKAVKWE